MPAKVTLHEVKNDDLPVFFEQQLDPEAQRMAGFPGRERDPFMAHWAKIMRLETATQNTVVADGQVAGNIGCWQDGEDCLVSYWLGRAYWGRGIATAALSQFLVKITARPLKAHVVKSNLASIRVLEKCGFRIVGEENPVGTDDPNDQEFVMELSSEIV